MDLKFTWITLIVNLFETDDHDFFKWKVSEKRIHIMTIYAKTTILFNSLLGKQGRKFNWKFTDSQAWSIGTKILWNLWVGVVTADKMNLNGEQISTIVL